MSAQDLYESIRECIGEALEGGEVSVFELVGVLRLATAEAEAAVMEAAEESVD